MEKTTTTEQISGDMPDLFFSLLRVGIPLCVFLRSPVRGIGARIIDPSILLFVPLLMIFREQRSNAENMIREIV